MKLCADKEHIFLLHIQDTAVNHLFVKKTQKHHSYLEVCQKQNNKQGKLTDLEPSCNKNKKEHKLVYRT